MNTHPVQLCSWRLGVILLAMAGAVVLIFSRPPIPQDPDFYNFADRRALLGVPYFADVVSNLPFLLVGVAGLRWYVRQGSHDTGVSWAVFFAGVALVSAGSGYFHWNPKQGTLVWDRLAMTVAFMGLFPALVGEFIHMRAGKLLLVPALLTGVASVLYWHRFNDLRFYAAVQYVPLMVIPLMMLLYRSRYSHTWFLPLALAAYAVAKVVEDFDREVFDFMRGGISGHTLKHLLAAAGCFLVFEMVRRRHLAARALDGPAQSLRMPANSG